MIEICFYFCFTQRPLSLWEHYAYENHFSTTFYYVNLVLYLKYDLSCSWWIRCVSHSQAKELTPPALLIRVTAWFKTTERVFRDLKWPALTEETVMIREDVLVSHSFEQEERGLAAYTQTRLMGLGRLLRTWLYCFKAILKENTDCLCLCYGLFTQKAKWIFRAVRLQTKSMHIFAYSLRQCEFASIHVSWNAMLPTSP